MFSKNAEQWTILSISAKLRVQLRIKQTSVNRQCPISQSWGISLHRYKIRMGKLINSESTEDKISSIISPFCRSRSKTEALRLRWRTDRPCKGVKKWSTFWASKHARNDHQLTARKFTTERYYGKLIKISKF